MNRSRSGGSIGDLGRIARGFVETLATGKVPQDVLDGPEKPPAEVCGICDGELVDVELPSGAHVLKCPRCTKERSR